MLRVKTYIAPSRIAGIGLFADQIIPAGSITWQYDPKFDMSFFSEDLVDMPEICREDFIKYAYFDYVQNKYVLCSDNQRFINHSAKPNIISTPMQDLAGRDISVGEELTCDYAEYEVDWFDRRGLDRRAFEADKDEA